MTTGKQIELSADEIRRLLPHRFPCLLLDRVVQFFPGRSVVALKNVSVNEPYFQGHFPQQFILPGVMIIEAAAQLTGLFIAATRAPERGGEEPTIGYLAAVRDFKFLKPVVPGDQLRILVREPQVQGSMARVAVEVSAGDATVAKGTLWVAGNVGPDAVTRGV